MSTIIQNTGRRARTLILSVPAGIGGSVTFYDAGPVELDDLELNVTLDLVDLDVEIPAEEFVAITSDIDYDIALDDPDLTITLDDDDLDVELTC